MSIAARPGASLASDIQTVDEDFFRSTGEPPEDPDPLDTEPCDPTRRRTMSPAVQARRPRLTGLVPAMAAMLLLLQVGCEITPPPEDPSSTEVGTAYAPSPPPLPPYRTPDSEQRSARHPSVDERTRPTPAEASADPFTAARLPEARAFVAGGEGRVLCPARYRPQRAGEGCACVSSADGKTRYPMVEPCDASASRIEGNECIFTCSVRPSGAADSASFEQHGPR